MWQKNTIGLHCWIRHSRWVLNGIHVAVAYNVTNRKLTKDNLARITKIFHEARGVMKLKPITSMKKRFKVSK